MNTTKQRGTRPGRATKRPQSEQGESPQSPQILMEAVQLMSIDEKQPEHLTIHAFLQRISHRWNLSDVNRFGAVVGKTATNMQLGWIKSFNPKLGEVRAFPVEFLQWIYNTMALSQGWPIVTDADLEANEEIAKVNAAVRGNEKARKHLQGLLDAADNIVTHDHLVAVMDGLDAEAGKLRERLHTLQHPTATPPTLEAESA